MSDVASQKPAPIPSPKWKFWNKQPPDPDSSHPDVLAKPDSQSSIPYFQLFRYTNAPARLTLFVSLLFAMAHGTMLPILTVIFGDVIDDLTAIFLDPDDPSHVPIERISSSLESTTRLFLILSFVVWMLSFFQLFLALRAANSIGNDLRTRFFSSLLRQNPAFYDSSTTGELTQLIVSDIGLIQAGVGDKLATAVQYVTTFVTGIIIGFIKGWQLTLLILAVTPVLLGSGFIFGQASSDATGDSLGSYGKANGVASEALSLIRTVSTFSAQRTEVKRYKGAVKTAYVSSVRAAFWSGGGLGTAMFCIICTYGLAFWFGATRVNSGNMKASAVLTTFFALTLGASSLGTAGPAFKSFSKARAAAPRVFNIIDRSSDIDPMDDDEGDIIPADQVHGRITFENVNFNYPNRITDDSAALVDDDDDDDSLSLKKKADDLVLNSLSLDIPTGSSEALVGKSGCGKSTMASLIQRLYDPQSGSIMMDGIDIRKLNVRWLRSQIGVVSQMPSLFSVSIRENIALGAGVTFDRDFANGDGTSSKTKVTLQQVSEEDIIRAAKLANAHDFIMKLPDGYDTLLGERGATLSGGQRQRVCIARSLVRNPRILILDESTASLDSESERIVQKALEQAAQGRTTVTIAHRLSTVRNCDNISCIGKGSVIERGSHDELLSKENGFYRGLFEMQNMEREKLQKEKDEHHDENEGLIEIPIGAGPTSTQNKSTTHGHADSLSKQQQAEEDIDSDGKKKKKRPDVDKGIFMRTLRLNLPEWPYIIVGGVGAAVAGVIWPVVSIALVNMIDIMSKPDVDLDDARLWSLMFVVLAMAAFLSNFTQHAFLGISGERLTLRLRIETFKALLRQEMGFFDDSKHSAGALATLLASDVSLIKGLTGDLLGIGLNIIGSLVSGLIIAFIACWRVTLVVLAIIPGVALGGYFEMQASAGFDSGARSEFAGANVVATEAVDNIGTVRSLGKEGVFLDKFKGIMARTNHIKLRKDLVTGFAYGFSEFCQYLIWYATFKSGGDFMEARYCTYKDVLQSSMAVLFAAVTFGNVSVFAPDVAASQLATTNVYRLLDRHSNIDPGDSDSNEPMDGDELRWKNVQGDVRAQRVYFEYPTRPHVPVLRGLSLIAHQGQTIAIVGPSGHGKSTIIALLQRFYNARAGKILMDDVDVTTVHVNSVRSKIGVVSQEPELFNRSVFDNIAYGLPHDDGSAVVTQEAVERAAKLANAHDFIRELPQGYDTMVGARGDALSGGQRQRVAIARSLIREPKVLLLDEATSALDNQSEKMVQKALENAARDRTTLIVAHRLSTIRNADVIVVVKSGRVVEAGNHDELLKKDGTYAKLVENQLTQI